MTRATPENAATADYGVAFRRWRATAGDRWLSYVEHAFVQALSEGSLPNAAYLHYLRQDYVFLIHFARAWGLTIAKSDTLDEMKLAAAVVNALVNVEMDLHVRVCTEAGIDAQALPHTPERDANLAYTRYVLDCGYSGDLLDLWAALAPCVLGYGEIGLRLQRLSDNPTYAEWIATYGGADYQDLCHRVGQAIDTGLVHRFGSGFADTPRFSRLGERFARASDLECRFWDMALSP